MNSWKTVARSATNSLQAQPLGPGAVQVRWTGNFDIEILKTQLNQILTVEGVDRLVHLCPEGDFKTLREARELGFLSEGEERTLDNGEVTHWWRSSRLRGEDPETTEVIDGSRPQHLVAEFHQVYDLPDLAVPENTPTVDFSRVHMRMGLIKEEFAELCGAVYGPAAEEALLEVFDSLPDDNLRDVVESADALGDLTYVIYGMALEAGINLDQVLAEVHRSNLSKLMPDGSVRRREDGKVLKGPGFSEPNIAAVIRSRRERKR